MTENHGVASSILALGILGLTPGRICGHSSAVERLLAKEKATSSNLVARSEISAWLIADGIISREPFVVSQMIYGDVAKLARQGSAKP